MSAERKSARSTVALDRDGAGLGPDGFERGHLILIQRARLLDAAGLVACEHGAGDVTVAQIVERAGVSRRTFYGIFDDGRDCVLAMLEDALQRAQARVLPAWGSGGSWRERVRRSLVELLALFDQEPVLARLLIVESLKAGERALERRARVLDALIDAVDEGQAQVGVGEQALRLSTEGAIGGVLAVLHARLTQQRPPGRLVELSGALAGMLMLPYHGRAAARRELGRPVPELPAPGGGEGSERPLRSDPFKDAGMRLTYRTMRVLDAVAGHPGSSNRRIGDLAELADQGQISKLLARLERIGMIVNEGDGRSRGEPNAWALTSAGRLLASSIRLSHTTSQAAAGTANEP